MYHYGFSGIIGAGVYDRRNTIASENVTAIPTGGNNDRGPVAMNVSLLTPAGVFQFEDSKTYWPNGDVTGIDKLSLQAANIERPYVSDGRRPAPSGCLRRNPRLPYRPASLRLKRI